MTDTDMSHVSPTADETEEKRLVVRKHRVRRFRFPPLIGFKEIIGRLRKFNFYRILREKAVSWYLKKMAACPKDDLLICWQPLYAVIIKVSAAVTLSLLLFSGYPYLAAWLKEGLTFFRLNEIYNFAFPEEGFFNGLAKGILLVIIGYYGLFFLFRQLQALFSSFAVSVPNRKAYYIKSFFIKKDLHVIAVPSLDYFAIKHNLLYRILGLGTLILKNRSGEKMKIRLITHAAQAVRKMSLLKEKEEDHTNNKKDPWDEI